jgi:hypothetical protein
MNRPASSLRCVLLGACVAVLAGCANRPPPPLYSWESFPKLQYATLKRDGATPAEQIGAMEGHAEKARAANAALPPGFRAHLGMLKLSAGDTDQARQMWQGEKLAFPESTPYMDQLLKRLDAPVKKDNPA